MNTELRNKAWQVLPKEFKEEVKKEYYDCKHCNADACAIELETVFGKHNLTSDVEGEDGLLTVPRSKVQEQYALNSNALREGNLTDMQTEIAVKVKDTLYYLFGAKCLPDETKQEPKQETTFFQNGNTHYSDNHFADVRKMADTRLNIAAMVMAGAIANKNVTIGCGAFEDNMEYITKTALMYADALIAECEKGCKL